MRRADLPHQPLGPAVYFQHSRCTFKKQNGSNRFFGPTWEENTRTISARLHFIILVCHFLLIIFAAYRLPGVGSLLPWANLHSSQRFSPFMLENELLTNCVPSKPPHILFVWQAAVPLSALFGSRCRKKKEKREASAIQVQIQKALQPSDNKMAARQRENTLSSVQTMEVGELNL